VWDIGGMVMEKREISTILDGGLDGSKDGAWDNMEMRRYDIYKVDAAVELTCCRKPCCIYTWRRKVLCKPTEGGKLI
jgi:hypothetical protein